MKVIATRSGLGSVDGAGGTSTRHNDKWDSPTSTRICSQSTAANICTSNTGLCNKAANLRTCHIGKRSKVDVDKRRTIQADTGRCDFALNVLPTFAAQMS